MIAASTLIKDLLDLTGGARAEAVLSGRIGDAARVERGNIGGLPVRVANDRVQGAVEK